MPDPTDRRSVPLERHWVESGDVRLHVRAAGPDDGPLVVLDDATHWVQHDAPERVTRHLLSHLAA